MDSESSWDDSVSNEHDMLCDEDFIVLDVETTGCDVAKNKIVQLAMIKVKTNGEVETWNRYFNPCMRRDAQMGAFRIHKISPDVLLSKKPFRQHEKDVMNFLRGVRYIIGHNIQFDWNFLFRELSSGSCSENDFLNIVLIDTYKCSISAFPNLSKYSLESLGNYLQIETFRRPSTNYGLSSPKKNKKEMIRIDDPEETSYHDALTDSMVTKELLEACLEQIQPDKKEDKYSLLDLELNKKQFVYPVKQIFFVDKLLKNSITNSEKIELYEFAKTFMCPLPRFRGKLLMQMSPSELHNSIAYLDFSNEQNLNDKRLRALMDLVCQGQPECTLDGESSSTTSNKRDSKIIEYFPQKKLKLDEELVTPIDKIEPPTTRNIPTNLLNSTI